MDSDTTNLPEEPSFFVFSSEAALVIVLGIVSFITYIYFIIKSGIFTSFFEAIGRRFPILNINHGNENPQDAQARRIHSDECSICFMPITYEVGAACGHIFCGNLFYIFNEREMHN